MESSRDIVVIASETELAEQESLDLANALKRQGTRLISMVRSSSITGDDLNHLDGVVAASVAETGLFPAPRDGIWRGIAAAGPGGDGQHAASTLTARVAGELGLQLPEGVWYLDFKIPPGGFQRIDASRVLGGDLPRSLVEGKVILVGKEDAADALISTSVHQGSEALSPLLFQAAVIDVLLRDGFIRIASPLVQWGVAAALAGLLALILRRRRLAHVLWLTLATAALAVFGSWLVMNLSQWWLPPTKAIALLGGVGGLVAGSTAAKQWETLRRALRSVVVETQDRAEKGGFLTTAAPWTLAEKMLDEAFGFDPSFVLRVDAQSGALSPTTDHGEAACAQFFPKASLQRDQEPFSAVLAGKEIPLDDGLVVLPIGTSARLFGFWGFGAEERRAVDQPRAYADRLAAMFEIRESWRERARPGQLAGDGAPLSGSSLHDQLEGSIQLLDSSRVVLAEALDRSTDAVLVYDAFGKLSHTSRPSVDLLGSAGVEFADASPVGLLVRLTKMDEDEIRRALRFVTLNRDKATFKASPGLVSGREFFIHIRALAGAVTPGGGDSAGLPGLIILIEDVTQSARAALLKDEFVEHIYFQLNNDFEAVLVASELIDDPRLEPDERAEVITMIKEKVEEAAARVKETRSHLSTEFSPGAVERYPIRFEPVFNAAKAAVGGELESRQVTIDASISDYLPLVLAAPEPLEDLLHTILLTLIHDAREESQIAVAVAQREGEVTVSLNNVGFGMPQERLDRYLEEGDGGHETLDKVGPGLGTVRAWDGELTVKSQIGAGMTFELKLASVL